MKPRCFLNYKKKKTKKPKETNQLLDRPRVPVSINCWEFD